MQCIRDDAAKKAKLAAASNNGPQISRYPSPEHRPIPKAVWRLILDIKGLPRSRVTGFPTRSALCSSYFQNDFDLVTGVLKVESALYQYRGDLKMLSELWWQFILPPPGLRKNGGDM